MYEFKNITVSIPVEHGPKIYGLVKRGGRVFFRNYKRPLKKGGMSFLDVFEFRVKEAEGRLLSALQNVYD